MTSYFKIDAEQHSWNREKDIAATYGRSTRCSFYV